MQRNETQSRTVFVRVVDSRNRAVRGLWRRGQVFYAQMRVEGHRSAVRIPLHDAQTVPQAVLALQGLRAKNASGEMPQVKQARTLRAAIEAYETYHAAVTGAKRASTLEREQCSFKHLLAWRADTRLNKINAKFAHEYAVARQSNGASGRAVDLEIVALRNVLKMAVRDGDLTTLPQLNWTKLAGKPKQSRLLKVEEIEAVCSAATGVYGAMFAEFFHLLAYCGGREQEVLRLRWSDVDFERKQLTVGRPTLVEDELRLSKNGEMRAVDFNPKLEQHLRAMVLRWQPNTEWLFPSPRSGGRDVPVSNFHKALKMAAEKAKVAAFGFHHLRHYFISQCVMAGIDYMTIAKWVAHKDGGVLIGKVYGHLNSEHTARQAARLSL